MTRKVIKWDEVRLNYEDDTVELYYKDKLVTDFNPEGLVEHWLIWRNKNFSNEVYKRV